MSDHTPPPRFEVEFGEGWHRIGPNAWVAAPGTDAPPPEPDATIHLGPGWRDVGYVDETQPFPPPPIEVEVDDDEALGVEPTTISFSTEGMSREYLETLYGGPLDGPRPPTRQKLSLGDREIGDITGFEERDDGTVYVHASVPAQVARELGLLPQLPSVSVHVPPPGPSWHTPPRDRMHMEINMPSPVLDALFPPPPTPVPNRADRRRAARSGRRKGR